MDRMIEADYGGQTYYLHYSVAVMFDVIEKYGSAQLLLDRIDRNDADGFSSVAWAFVRMTQEGELMRRGEGHPAADMLGYDDITIYRLKPYEYIEMHRSVVEAITLGYVRDTKRKDEDIDIGLAELREKKTEAERTEEG